MIDLNEIERLEKIEKIRRLLRLVNRELDRQINEHLHRYQITVPQFYLLREIHRQNHLSLHELSRRLMLANSTVSDMVNRLEKKGLLKRQRSLDDRRLLIISSTPLMDELRQKLQKKLLDYFEELSREIDDRDIEQILDSLTMLQNVLAVNKD